MTTSAFDDLLPDLEGFDDERYIRILLEQTDQINQLAQHIAWPIYVDYLIALTQNLQERVLSGGCKTMEEYNRFTGRIEGMRVAMQAPDRLLSQVQALREQSAEDVELNGGG